MFADFEYYLCAATLICSMVGMGTTLTVGEFGKVARSPKAIVLIFVLQLVVSPLVAIALARVFHVSQGVAFGMLLIAALPGGLFSNLMTYLGRGNVALSVAATSVGSVACLATTAFVLKTYGAAQLPAGFHMPMGRILLDIGGNALLPLAVGMLIRRIAPAHSGRLGKYCIRGSILLLGIYIAFFIGSGRFSLAEYGIRTPLALLLFGIIMVWMSYLAGSIARLSLDDSYTVAIEVLFRNAYLGVLLKASLFPAGNEGSERIGQGALFAVLIYGTLALCTASVETWSKRRGLGIHSKQRRRSSGSMPSGKATGAKPTAEHREA